MIAIAQFFQLRGVQLTNMLFGDIERHRHPGHKQLFLPLQVPEDVRIIEDRIAHQITALLRCFQAFQMQARHLGKGFLVVGVAAERLHVHRNTSLILAHQLQHHLVQFRPVVAAVPPDQTEASSFIVGRSGVFTIDMKTGDIQMHRIRLQTQLLNHPLGQYLVQDGDIGFVQRIQAPS